jgi:hypothetical protein
MTTMPGFTAERSLDARTHPYGHGRVRADPGGWITAQAIHRHKPIKEPILSGGGSGGGGGIVVDIGPAVIESCQCPCCMPVGGHTVCCGPAPQ